VVQRQPGEIVRETLSNISNILKKRAVQLSTKRYPDSKTWYFFNIGLRKVSKYGKS
jgi:hypothetical protein